MDWVKEIFGDVSDEQMEKFKKSLGESFVPNEVHRKKVDTLTGELTATSEKLTQSQTTIEELNGKLSDFKPEEIEGYKETINKLTGDLETFKSEGQLRETRLMKKYAMKDQLMGAGMNPDAVDWAIEQYKGEGLDKYTLGEDGKIADFDTNILNPMKESKPSLFAKMETDTKPPKPDAGGDDDNLDAIRKAMGL